MSCWFWPDDDLVGSGGGPVPAHGSHFLAVGRRLAACARKESFVSGRPQLARFSTLLRVFPWRQWLRCRSESSDRMDRTGQQIDATERGVGMKVIGVSPAKANALQQCLHLEAE